MSRLYLHPNIFGCVIFPFKGFSPTHLSRTPIVGISPTISGIVVERVSIILHRYFAADCPYMMEFPAIKTSLLYITI